jgi:ATP-dependent DNA helicase DinG
VTLADRVRAALADDGPLAGTIGGFEARPGQRQLAGHVADAFERGRTLIAEAGTGTGKTLAYLLPAVLGGKRVLISTGTRTLQDQIFYKDVPALAEALGAPIKAAYMKGRTNYLCLHRFGRLQEAEAGLEAGDRRWLRTIADWAAETQTGDRAEIEDMPDDLPLWQEVTANAEQCLGRDCPQHLECFVTRMKERAAESDLVIVNHHLLCADASVRQGGYGEVIPECDLAVIDEAHQLEDVVTMYFGVVVSTHRVDELARDASAAAGAIPGQQAMAAVALATAVSDVQHACRRLFDGARAELRGVESAGDRMTMSPSALERLGELGALVRSALGRLSSLLGDAPGNEDASSLAARARDLADDINVVLTADPAYVNYVEARGRGISLRAAPIEVSRIVKTAIIGDRAATVLTSATLAVEGQFEYVKTRLGLEDAEAVQLPSEFDFTRQAILYLPPEMPDPRSAEFNRAAAWVISERTRVRAIHLVRGDARRARDHRAQSELAVVRARHGPADIVVARLSQHAQRRTARDGELLARRRRRGRGAELRDHRPAAVRLAGRSARVRTHQGDRRSRRTAVPRVPSAAGHPDVASGPGSADSDQDRSRRVGDSRSASDADALRPPVSGIAAAGADYGQPGCRGAVSRDGLRPARRRVYNFP